MSEPHLGLGDGLRMKLVRSLMNSKIMDILEDSMFKTQGMIGRYIFQPGAILREPEWNFELLKTLCDQNFVIEMITRTLTQEIARPKLEIKPRFVKKCENCGAEYQSDIEQCEKCQGTKLRDPDPNEKSILEDIIKRPNPDFDWDRMIRSIVEHDLKNGNWWLSLTYQRYVDPKKVGVQRKIAEIYNEDPRYMRIMADEKGRIRSHEYFCPNCYVKDEFQTISEEDVKNGRIPVCPKCQQPLVMTAYKQVVSGSTIARWGVDEVIHGSSTQTLPELYGRPRALSIWKWLIIINAMVNYMSEIYSTGYMGGFLIFKGLEQRQVNAIKAQVEKEIETRQVIDPVTGNPIYSLRVRTAWIGAGTLDKVPLDASFISSMPEPRKMESLDTLKFAVEKVCSVYGVTPVFVGVIEGGRAGTNPRMQIDVQNRSIEEHQNAILSTLNHQFVPRLKVFDWIFDFEDIEIRDELRIAQVQEVQARAAATWISAGFDVSIDPNTGELEISGTGHLTSAPPLPAGQSPSGPEISEASGAIIGKDRYLPPIAMYLVEPHGFLVWKGEKKIIVKTQRYPNMEDQPLLLVGPQSAYGVIKLKNPRQITQTQFVQLRKYHRVTATEVRQWGWDKAEQLWAYDVELMDRFEPPLPVALPKGTQSFVHTENIEIGRDLAKMVFFRDEEGQLRIIPEGEEEAHEYGRRVSEAERITTPMAGTPYGDWCSKRLRGYTSEDLKSLKEIRPIRSAAEKEQWKELYGFDYDKVAEAKAQGGGWYAYRKNGGNPQTIYCNTYDVLAFEQEPLETGQRKVIHGVMDHEFAHHITWLRTGQTSLIPEDKATHDYWDNVHDKLRTDISAYAGNKNWREGVAETHIMMRKYPSACRALAAKDPEVRGWFQRVRAFTGYKIIPIPEKRGG